MLFSAYTFGCKLNQLETEAISDSFCREGFDIIPALLKKTQVSDPSVIVINTCTVTSMAEQKARRLIRKLLREQPLACLIITGCYAQMDSAELLKLQEELHASQLTPGRVFVIPGKKKDRIMDLPRFLAEADEPEQLPHLIASWVSSDLRSTDCKSEDCKHGDGSFRFKPEKFSSHSRGFLKIQDGCDRRCTFCRVSLARGQSRSLGAAEVLNELNALEERGFMEAVLTGVNIAQYRDSEMDLAGLLDFLLKGTEKIRLRLSSIEPDELNDEFIQVLVSSRIQPHFHLSLQSGSAEILEKMGRPGNPEKIEKTLKQLRSVRHDPFLACDIIAGFPGESDEEFEKTYKFCQKNAFAWIHAFPFSPRPGTAAINFSPKVPESDAVRRVNLLTALAKKGRRDYLGRWLGKEVEAIVEGEGKNEKGKEKREMRGAVPGVSENYLKLLIDNGGSPVPAPGSLVKCRILQPADEAFDAFAERVE